MKKAFIQLHLAVFLAGFTGILGKLITLNEALLVWYRLLITCLILWLFSKLAIRRSPPSLSQKIKAGSIGIILITHWVSFYAGVKYGNVSTALVCFSSVGFFTAIFEPVLLRKKIDWVELLLGLLVIAGISIIFHFDPKYKLCIAISMGSAVVASIFPILNWKLLQTMEAAPATRYQLIGGLLFLTLAMPFYLHFFPGSRLLPSSDDWFWLFFLALLCTVLAFSLMMRAQQKIPAFTLNLTYSLEPIYGVALAFIVFREDRLVSREFYYGFGMIVLAVALQMLRLRRISGKRNQAALVEI